MTCCDMLVSHNPQFGKTRSGLPQRFWPNRCHLCDGTTRSAQQLMYRALPRHPCRVRCLGAARAASALRPRGVPQSDELPRRANQSCTIPPHENRPGPAKRHGPGLACLMIVIGYRCAPSWLRLVLGGAAWAVGGQAWLHQPVRRSLARQIVRSCSRNEDAPAGLSVGGADVTFRAGRPMERDRCSVERRRWRA